MIDTTILDTLQRPHLSGHRCPDGRGVLGWFNHKAGDRLQCPVLTACAQLRTAITEQHELLTAARAAVHESAHDDAAMCYVATALLGGTPLNELDPEIRDGWVLIAQLGTEALAHWLDPDVITDDARPS